MTMNRPRLLTYGEWHRKRLDGLHGRLSRSAVGHRSNRQARHAWLSMQAAWSCFVIDDQPNAVQLYEQAIQALDAMPARERADDVILCLAHNDLAFVLNRYGSGDRALAEAQQALVLAARLKCRPLERRALSNRAAALLQLKRYPEVIQCYQPNRELLSSPDGPLEQIIEHMSLYVAHVQSGGGEEASKHLAQARRFMRKSAATGAADTRTLLDELSSAIAEPATIAPLLMRLRCTSRMPAPNQPVSGLGATADDPDLLRRLAHNFRQQIGRVHARGDHVIETHLRLRLARLYIQLEEYAAAIQTIEAALTFNLPQSLRAAPMLGAALCLSGQIAEAATCHIAMAIRGEGEARAVELDSMLFLSLGSALLIEGDGWQADEFYRLALELLDSVEPNHVNGEFGRVWCGLHYLAQLGLAEAQLLQDRPQQAVYILRPMRPKPESVDPYRLSYGAMRAHVLARAHEMLNSPIQAQHHWEELQHLIEPVGDTALEVDALCGLARGFLNLGDYLESIEIEIARLILPDLPGGERRFEQGGRMETERAKNRFATERACIEAAMLHWSNDGAWEADGRREPGDEVTWRLTRTSSTRDGSRTCARSWLRSNGAP